MLNYLKAEWSAKKKRTISRISKFYSIIVTDYELAKKWWTRSDLCVTYLHCVGQETEPESISAAFWNSLGEINFLTFLSLHNLWGIKWSSKKSMKHDCRWFDFLENSPKVQWIVWDSRCLLLDLVLGLAEVRIKVVIRLNSWPVVTGLWNTDQSNVIPLMIMLMIELTVYDDDDNRWDL